MIYLLIVIIGLLYIYGLFRWSKWISWHLNTKLTKTIKYTHYIALLICLIVGFLFIQYNIGLRGLWTTRFVAMIFLFSGIFFFLFADKTVINRIEYFYFKIFSYFPVALAGFLLVPFIGFIIVISLFGRLVEPANKIYFQDDKIRVQSTFVGVLTEPRLEIYKKSFLFEQNIPIPHDFSVDCIETVVVNYDKDSTRIKCRLNIITEHGDSIIAVNIEKIK